MKLEEKNPPVASLIASLCVCVCTTVSFILLYIWTMIKKKIHFTVRTEDIFILNVQLMAKICISHNIIILVMQNTLKLIRMKIKPSATLKLCSVAARQKKTGHALHCELLQVTCHQSITSHLFMKSTKEVSFLLVPPVM